MTKTRRGVVRRVGLTASLPTQIRTPGVRACPGDLFRHSLVSAPRNPRIRTPTIFPVRNPPPHDQLLLRHHTVATLSRCLGGRHFETLLAGLES